MRVPPSDNDWGNLSDPTQDRFIRDFIIAWTEPIRNWKIYLSGTDIYQARRTARWERYWQTELPQWEGGRLFEPSANFFLRKQPIFFKETAVIPERKVEKSFPRWEINRHAES